MSRFHFKNFPRMSGWLFTAVMLVLIIWLSSPQQLPVALYKLSLISLAAVFGYSLDCSLFPYARPDGYLNTDDWTWALSQGKVLGDADLSVADGYHTIFAVAMLRRAIIVGTVVVSVALGL